MTNDIQLLREANKLGYMIFWRDDAAWFTPPGDIGGAKGPFATIDEASRAAIDDAELREAGVTDLPDTRDVTVAFSILRADFIATITYFVSDKSVVGVKLRRDIAGHRVEAMSNPPLETPRWLVDLIKERFLK